MIRPEILTGFPFSLRGGALIAKGGTHRTAQWRLGGCAALDGRVKPPPGHLDARVAI
jgi:hypothetical protein